MRRTVGAVLISLLLVAGCSGLPVDGPIVETRTTPEVDEAQPMEIDPVPPQPGASAADIATGFLDAMTGWPQRIDVAREFLSTDAKASWNAEAATTTYVDIGPLAEEGGTVSLQLIEPERIDARGAWQGRVPEEDAVLRLQMVQEDGEYRIANPPDGQFVPSDWFADRYRQANLYFLDRTQRILVPEPVFVPRGVQLATTLVSRLLTGPPDERIETTAFPSGLSVELGVPVSDDGVADIQLDGAAPPQSADVVEMMLAQLAWTLRQEDITSLRLSFSGQEVRLPGGVSEFGVDSAPEFSPAGYQTSKALFGLSGGVLVSGNREELKPVDGPLGHQRPVREVGVSLDGTTAAAVSNDGHRLVLAPVGSESSIGVPNRVVTVVDHATDLLPPAWDFANRLWLVDRGPDGAEVSYLDADRDRRRLHVPDVSGERVTSFVVSRDGTRFVAVVRVDGADQLRVGRIVVQDSSRVLRVLPTEEISLDGVGGSWIKDIAWTSTTTIAVLSFVDRGLFDVQTVAVDGAPSETSSVSVGGRVIGLAGTPAPDSRQYAVTPDGLIDLTTTPATQFLEPEVSTLNYVG